MRVPCSGNPHFPLYFHGSDLRLKIWFYAFQTALASDAAFFQAAEWNVCSTGLAIVPSQDPEIQSFLEADTVTVAFSEEIRCQTIFSVIRLFNRLIKIAEGLYGSNRTERLFIHDDHVICCVRDYSRFDEITFRIVPVTAGSDGTAFLPRIIDMFHHFIITVFVDDRPERGTLIHTVARLEFFCLLSEFFTECVSDVLMHIKSVVTHTLLPGSPKCGSNSM